MLREGVGQNRRQHEGMARLPRREVWPWHRRDLPGVQAGGSHVVRRRWPGSEPHGAVRTAPCQHECERAVMDMSLLVLGALLGKGRSPRRDARGEGQQ